MSWRQWSAHEFLRLLPYITTMLSCIFLGLVLKFSLLLKSHVYGSEGLVKQADSEVSFSGRRRSMARCSDTELMSINRILNLRT